jgi:site-specific recombinase XerD
MKTNVMLSDYVNYLDLNLGYSGSTIKTYKLHASHFMDFLESKNIKLNKIGKGIIEEYVCFLRNVKKNASKTIRLKIAVIRSLLKYLNEVTKTLKKNPIKKGDFRYKVEKKDSKSLSVNQIESLLNILVGEKDKLDQRLGEVTGKRKLLYKQLFAIKRDYVFIKLLLSTGLRISEALNIRFKDIDFIDKSIIITGKGKRIREVFFDIEELSNDFVEYVNYIKDLSLPHEYIFVSIKNFNQMTSRGFQLLLKKYLKLTKISTVITPHSLRHTFASISIEKGANIKAVSQILGHADVQITINTYTHLSSEHIREVMKRCHPLSKEIIPLNERIENRLKSLVYLAKTG